VTWGFERSPRVLRMGYNLVGEKPAATKGNNKSDKTELTRLLADLEAILSNAEHNGVNLIFAMGGPALCAMTARIPGRVRESLRILRAHMPAETEAIKQIALVKKKGPHDACVISLCSRTFGRRTLLPKRSAAQQAQVAVRSIVKQTLGEHAMTSYGPRNSL